jgi:hypothetical protein
VKSESISIIVFEKDAAEDLYLTLKTLRLSLEKFPDLQSEIIVIDDASSIKPSKFHKSLSEVNIAFLEINVGISGAIYHGALMAKYNWLLAVPGTNMYTVEAYSNVFDMISQKCDAIIGTRINLWEERPLAKYLASKLLLKSFRVLIQRTEVQDIHGLNAFKTKDVLEHLPPKGRHGGQMQLLAKVLLLNKSFKTIVTPINNSHMKRSSAKLADKKPSLRGIFDAVKGLFHVLVLRISHDSES